MENYLWAQFVIIHLETLADDLQKAPQLKLIAGAYVIVVLLSVADLLEFWYMLYFAQFRKYTHRCLSRSNCVWHRVVTRITPSIYDFTIVCLDKILFLSRNHRQRCLWRHVNSNSCVGRSLNTMFNLSRTGSVQQWTGDKIQKPGNTHMFLREEANCVAMNTYLILTIAA